MIERKFIKHNVTESKIREFVLSSLGRAGIGNIKLQLTPLGEKIVVFSSNPGLVVGKEGGNIKDLTAALKRNFNLENPQIEISEVQDPNTNAQIVADRVAGALERYGSGNFKGIMHKTISDVMNSGVRGVEMVLSGKIPGSRAKSWRILSGYMKKCGDIAVAHVNRAISTANLKSGVIGIRIKIMHSDVELPDTVRIKEEEAKEIIVEESNKEYKEIEEAKKKQEEEKAGEKTGAAKARKPRAARKKKNDKEIKDVPGNGQGRAESEAQ
jgi:small subunit ribosomal protein S3